MTAIALLSVLRFLLSRSPSGKYMLTCSSCEELLGTEKADATDKRQCAEMGGGRNCLGKDFGVEANAGSFVTCSSCLSIVGMAGVSTVRVRHELQMAEMLQGKR